jgi:hypothetical protein
VKFLFFQRYAIDYALCGRIGMVCSGAGDRCFRVGRRASKGVRSGKQDGQTFPTVARCHQSASPTFRAFHRRKSITGIEAGRNAGCWTVGITRTGNCVGLSAEEADALPAEELRHLCDAAESRLTAAAAHYVIPFVAEFPEVLVRIEQRMGHGE